MSIHVTAQTAEYEHIANGIPPVANNRRPRSMRGFVKTIISVPRIPVPNDNATRGQRIHPPPTEVCTVVIDEPSARDELDIPPDTHLGKMRPKISIRTRSISRLRAVRDEDTHHVAPGQWCHQVEQNRFIVSIAYRVGQMQSDDAASNAGTRPAAASLLIELVIDNVIASQLFR